MHRCLEILNLFLVLTRISQSFASLTRDKFHISCTSIYLLHSELATIQLQISALIQTTYCTQLQRMQFHMIIKALNIDGKIIDGKFYLPSARVYVRQILYDKFLVF